MTISSRLKSKWLLIVLLLLIIGVAAALLLTNDGTQKVAQTTVARNKSAKNERKSEQKLPIINLQPTVDKWAAKQSGTASVVVIDLANDKTVAKLNPDRKYFTASLYKLYVAYQGYLKVQDGTYSLRDSYLGSYSRGECLDLMIRESYSPCGEKMWNELGKEKLTGQLEDYDIENTSLTDLTTTAQDSALLLQRLFNRKDLNEKYTKLYLDSLKDQPVLYRRGLPKGFKNSAVYNKVGWNGTVEWHDAAIITLSNDRSYVVSVLTENVGAKNIIALAEAIEAKLSK